MKFKEHMKLNWSFMKVKMVAIEATLINFSNAQRVHRCANRIRRSYRKIMASDDAYFMQRHKELLSLASECYEISEGLSRERFIFEHDRKIVRVDCAAMQQITIDLMKRSIDINHEKE